MKLTPSWLVVGALALALALGWGLAKWQDRPQGPAPSPARPPSPQAQTPSAREPAPWLRPFETPTPEEPAAPAPAVAQTPEPTQGPAAEPTAPQDAAAQAEPAQVPAEAPAAGIASELREVHGFLLRSSAPGYPNWGHNTASAAVTGGFLSIEKPFLSPEDLDLESELVPVLTPWDARTWDGTPLASQASFADWFADRLPLDLMPRVYVRVQGRVPEDVAVQMDMDLAVRSLEENLAAQDPGLDDFQNLVNALMQVPAPTQASGLESEPEGPPPPPEVKLYVLQDAQVLDYQVLSPTWMAAWKRAWPKLIEARRVFRDWLAKDEPPTPELAKALAAALEVHPAMRALCHDQAYDIYVGPVIDENAAQAYRADHDGIWENSSFQEQETVTFERELDFMRGVIKEKERRRREGK